MCLAIFPCHLSKVLHLPRKKRSLANLKIWCSKMQTLSGNQRPDLLTCLWRCLLYCACHTICIFAEVQNPSLLPRERTLERPKVIRTCSFLKHVHCNPDVAPRLTSGGYEDKVDVITPLNIVHMGWQILIPNEDKVDVLTPINIVHRGWQILIPYEDKVDVITPTNILFT